jgi:hypothetical protein
MLLIIHFKIYSLSTIRSLKNKLLKIKFTIYLVLLFFISKCF